MNIAGCLDVSQLTARERILLAAHEEMYEHGFQGLRIEAVLKKTQLAKGALYHYFPTKMALGYAVVDELITSFFLQNWNEFLSTSKDPLRALQDFFHMKGHALDCGEPFNGCPLNNLAQEMSTLDAGFNQRLQTLMFTIINTVTLALQQGQVDGIVRLDIQPQKEAAFLLSSYQGIMGAAKCMQSEEVLQNLFDTLCKYVENMRLLKSDNSLIANDRGSVSS